jgi:uncharacterized protein involved in outer membrane biogenesis
MKKGRKSLRITVATILIVVLVILILIDVFAGHAVKLGIEVGATKALNVAVKVGGVNLALTRGRFGIEKLSIDNPPGYQHDKMLELDEARIAVNITSLLGDTVNIKEIYLDGMEVVLEQRMTGNNIQDIISSIETKEKKPSKPAEPSEAPGKKLHVESLEISNVTVKAKLLPVPGKKDTVILKLSPIKMTNLGADNKMDTAKLSSKILLAIADGVARQGAGILPSDMVDTMKSSLDKTMALGKTAAAEGKKVIESSADVGKDVIEGGKDIGKEIGEGLKGIFKRK